MGCDLEQKSVFHRRSLNPSPPQSLLIEPTALQVSAATAALAALAGIKMPSRRSGSGLDRPGTLSAAISGRVRFPQDAFYWW